MRVDGPVARTLPAPGHVTPPRNAHFARISCHGASWVLSGPEQHPGGWDAGVTPVPGGGPMATCWASPAGPRAHWSDAAGPPPQGLQRKAAPPPVRAGPPGPQPLTCALWQGPREPPPPPRPTLRPGLSTRRLSRPRACAAGRSWGPGLGTAGLLL